MRSAVPGTALRACSQLFRQSESLPQSEQLRACFNHSQLRWASKKQGGSTQNTKDSNPKMLGVKLYGGQHCIPGNIIVRQRGTEFHPGANVGLGRDHTIYAMAEGHIKFKYSKLTKRRTISVETLQQQQQQQQVALKQVQLQLP